MTDYSKRDSYTNRLYRIFKTMHSRCYNPNASEYNTYGGRGISICNEWKRNFDAFRMWSIDHGYDDSLTIDRINNNGDYSPDNCRWVDRYVQQNNTSRNVFVTIGNETKTVSEWCREYNINLHTFYGRLRMGWDINRALTEPSRGRIDSYNITHNSKTQSIAAWAKELGINRYTLTRRLNVLNWPVDRALTEPAHSNGRKRK